MRSRHPDAYPLPTLYTSLSIAFMASYQSQSKNPTAKEYSGEVQADNGDWFNPVSGPTISVASLQCGETTSSYVLRIRFYRVSMG